MPASFAGFQPQALEFFLQLEQNNSREWFQPRKEMFDQLLKAPMLELVGRLNRQVPESHTTEPSRAVYRIHRDTRFSKDKTPYKTHIAANFPRHGLEKHAAAGYYFSVSHKQIEVAGGVYMPGPNELLAIRKRLHTHHAEFRKMGAAARVEKACGPLQGESLTRVPKGFEPDHPAADLLKRKQWYYYVLLDAGLALSGAVEKEVALRFKLMQPVVDWLNEAIDAGRARSARQRDPLRRGM
ncbi:MAG: DUF2461 domain-containing protein [Acidobacteria bacterium]|nr:DUF2461 domain-containing protein [Acidobacteriota bacterium]